MRLTRKAALLGAAFALTSVFTLAACGDDEPGIVDLTGNYEVSGFGVSENPATAPVVNEASGNAELTSTTYNIAITGVGTSSGDYEAFDNGTFTQDGTTTPVGGEPFDTQCTGTYAIVNSVLTIDTTCGGVRTATVLTPLD